MVDAVLDAAGYKRRVVLAVPHFHAVARAVARGRLIAAVPQQFATRVAAEFDLLVFEPPVAVPASEIKLYWHRRHDDEAAHRWMRTLILAIARGL
jgi:DNA-binding transcriptional LysR family regulator